MFRFQILNLPASLQNKNTRIGLFPWKRSILQNPDRERTNQSTGICLRLGLPYNNATYSSCGKLTLLNFDTLFKQYQWNKPNNSQLINNYYTYSVLIPLDPPPALIKVCKRNQKASESCISKHKKTPQNTRKYRSKHHMGVQERVPMRLKITQSGNTIFQS